VPDTRQTTNYSEPNSRK